MRVRLLSTFALLLLSIINSYSMNSLSEEKYMNLMNGDLLDDSIKEKCFLNMEESLRLEFFGSVKGINCGAKKEAVNFCKCLNSISNLSPEAVKKRELEEEFVEDIFHKTLKDSMEAVKTANYLKDINELSFMGKAIEGRGFTCLSDNNESSEDSKFLEFLMEEEFKSARLKGESRYVANTISTIQLVGEQLNLEGKTRSELVEYFETNESSEQLSELVESKGIRHIKGIGALVRESGADVIKDIVLGALPSQRDKRVSFEGKKFNDRLPSSIRNSIKRSCKKISASTSSDKNWEKEIEEKVLGTKDYLLYVQPSAAAEEIRRMSLEKLMPQLLNKYFTERNISEQDVSLKSDEFLFRMDQLMCSNNFSLSEEEMESVNLIVDIQVKMNAIEEEKKKVGVVTKADKEFNKRVLAGLKKILKTSRSSNVIDMDKMDKVKDTLIEFLDLEKTKDGLYLIPDNFTAEFKNIYKGLKNRLEGESDIKNIRNGRGESLEGENSGLRGSSSGALSDIEKKFGKEKAKEISALADKITRIKSASESSEGLELISQIASYKSKTFMNSKYKDLIEAEDIKETISHSIGRTPVAEVFTVSEIDQKEKEINEFEKKVSHLSNNIIEKNELTPEKIVNYNTYAAKNFHAKNSNDQKIADVIKNPYKKSQNVKTQHQRPASYKDENYVSKRWSDTNVNKKEEANEDLNFEKEKREFEREKLEFQRERLAKKRKELMDTKSSSVTAATSVDGVKEERSVTQGVEKNRIDFKKNERSNTPSEGSVTTGQGTQQNQVAQVASANTSNTDSTPNKVAATSQNRGYTAQKGVSSNSGAIVLSNSKQGEFSDSFNYEVLKEEKPGKDDRPKEFSSLIVHLDFDITKLDEKLREDEIQRLTTENQTDQLVLVLPDGNRIKVEKKKNYKKAKSIDVANIFRNFKKLKSPGAREKSDTLSQRDSKR